VVEAASAASRKPHAARLGTVGPQRGGSTTSRSACRMRRARGRDAGHYPVGNSIARGEARRGANSSSPSCQPRVAWAAAACADLRSQPHAIRGNNAPTRRQGAVLLPGSTNSLTRDVNAKPNIGARRPRSRTPSDRSARSSPVAATGRSARSPPGALRHCRNGQLRTRSPLAYTARGLSGAASVRPWAAFGDAHVGARPR
jgi:hypothetical protein